MKIYLDKTQLDIFLSSPHGYTKDLENISKNIQSNWKLQLSLEKNIIECQHLDEANLVFLHLLEYPLNLPNKNMYLWFHYEPTLEELQQLDQNQMVVGWIGDKKLFSKKLFSEAKCQTARFFPSEIPWHNLMLSKSTPQISLENQVHSIFLRLVKPICEIDFKKETSDEKLDNGFLVEELGTNNTRKQKISFDISACHIGFHQPENGLLISRDEVSSDIFESLQATRIPHQKLPKNPHFVWREFVGSNFPMENQDVPMTTSISQNGEKMCAGIPPFHSWQYSTENTIHLEVPDTRSLTDSAWVTVVLSRQHLKQIKQTLSQLSISSSRPCYIYYFSSIYNITLDVGKLSSNIFRANLNNVLAKESSETLMTLFAIYQTPAKTLVYFHPDMTPLEKIDIPQNGKDTIFFHRTQFYEDSYLHEKWLSNYLTYDQQKEVVDVDQNLFFFSRERDWYALLVAIWIRTHVRHQEENTASQLLAIGLQSLQLPYKISTETELRVIAIQELALGFASHKLLSTYWSPIQAASYKSRIKDVICRQVPYQWKSTTGCLVSLTSLIESNQSS